MGYLYFQVDSKASKDKNLGSAYLTLPSLKKANSPAVKDPNMKNSGYSLLSKDSFFIKTTLCSTKFTQNGQFCCIIYLGSVT